MHIIANVNVLMSFVPIPCFQHCNCNARQDLQLSSFLWDLIQHHCISHVCCDWTFTTEFTFKAAQNRFFSHMLSSCNAMRIKLMKRTLPADNHAEAESSHAGGPAAQPTTLDISTQAAESCTAISAYSLHSVDRQIKPDNEKEEAARDPRLLTNMH